MSRQRDGILSVGLTGGIACGRTTVCGVFSRRGACVVDADAIAHRLMAPGGAAVGTVVGAFGGRFLAPDGGIDRRALAKEVFADPTMRRRLESILHPMIVAEADKIIDAFAATAGRGVAVTDAALLVETGGYTRYQRLIVVTCTPAVQLERLMKRDKLSEKDARARIAAQAPLAEKQRLADYIIETSGSLEQTKARSNEVYTMLLDDLKRLPDLPRRRPT
ncbi:MAG: dephospho-CoA kinase [Acidobacteriota bacterium]